MESLTSSSSEWEEELETAAVFAILNKQNKKSIRSCWVHEIKKRLKLGEFHRLVHELRNDPRRFHMYFRMTKDEFDYVHNLIKKDIQKQSTQFRKPISTEERLAVCLR